MGNEARELFEAIRDGGVSVLQQMLADGQEETLWLDFKRVTNDAGPLTRADQKNLAEALSGFANADGGVIVWGGDCRTSGGNDPDVLIGLPGVANLERTTNQLRRLSPTYLAPGLNGVEHFPVDDGAVQDRGFVLTYVPRWDGAEPQMAMGPDGHVYFCRSNARFVRMEHYQVADRFARRAKPALQLECLFLSDGGADEPNLVEYQVLFNLTNVGSASAQHVAVAVRLVTDFNPGKLYPAPYWQWLDNIHPANADGLYRVLRHQQEAGIYPNTTVTVATLKTKLSEHAINSFSMTFKIFCDGWAGDAAVELNQEKIEALPRATRLLD